MTFVLVAGCSSTDPKPVKPAASTAPKAAVSPAATEGNGTSCDDLIVIVAANENDGINAETAWMRKHYPGFRRGGQALLQCGDKAADRIDITTAQGESRRIYFDISSFFGKW
ncbi:MAG TPA: hypothetical protein VEZ11_11350 [Thermoanaerobaculia bacterium]|nr:hypothetical protein [Thermoanaerobaculia bacterium]